MSPKMATQDLLKIKVFWKYGYDVTIFVHDIMKQILSRDSNCVVDLVMWPVNSSIYIREIIITSIL